MWSEQYLRMIRSVERVQPYYDGLTGLDSYDGSKIFPEFRDAVIHLFQDIFNLRDWLKSDPSVEIPNHEIDAKCSGNPEACPNLHIARDVANGSKHLKISRPSQNADTKVAGTGRISISFGAGAEMKTTVLKHSILIELGAGEYADALEVAKGAISEWREALADWGLEA